MADQTEVEAGIQKGERIIARLFLPAGDDLELPREGFNLRTYDRFLALFDFETNALGAGCDEAILDAVSVMRANIAVTRGDLHTQLSAIHEHLEDKLEHAIHCAVRIWLMINTRPARFDGTAMDLSPVQSWGENQRLCDFVYGVFYPGRPASYPTPSDNYTEQELSDIATESAQIQTRLTHPLTAVNLSRYPKVHIHWTRYLPEHLQFEHNFKDVNVFEHKQWLADAVALLEWHAEQEAQKVARRRSAEEGLGPIPHLNDQGGIPADNDSTLATDTAATPSTTDTYITATTGTDAATVQALPPFPIPLEVLKEALLTLDYLFPPDEKPTTEFLRRRHNRNFDILEVTSSSGPTKPRLRDFRYYHDRLVEIAQEYLNPPRDWSTVWSDNRNPVQFWTFWFGLLILIITLIFGVMATVLAGLQYGAAIHPPENGGGSEPRGP
ncbi:uncharacterized protein B0H64DRAFT_229327 [Chaetomium fimeti]|uniref:Uncharacterized protein n=1 Tax=Chaetomium fimeti TaxID=1854472 RepID=A0AAE0H9U3_9PEZI|nr:hypothetical protein B0H64DRAFT_229327 [Chaetomium fimeti]